MMLMMLESTSFVIDDIMFAISSRRSKCSILFSTHELLGASEFQKIMRFYFFAIFRSTGLSPDRNREILLFER